MTPTIENLKSCKESLTSLLISRKQDLIKHSLQQLFPIKGSALFWLPSTASQEEIIWKKDNSLQVVIGEGKRSKQMRFGFRFYNLKTLCLALWCLFFPLV
jgi:hypothetical protein